MRRSYSQIHFTYRCIFPTWSDWDIKYTAQGLLKKRVKILLSFLAYAAGIAGLYRVWRGGYTLGDLPGLLRMVLRLGLLDVAEGAQKLAGRT